MAYQGYQRYTSYDQGYNSGYNGNESGGYRAPRPVSVTVVPQGQSSIVEVGGGSFDIKEDLKSIGFRFDGNKKVWYVESSDSNAILGQVQQFASAIGTEVEIKSSPVHSLRQPLQGYNQQNLQNAAYGAQNQQFGGQRYSRGVQFNVQRGPEGGNTVTLSGQTFDIKDALKPLGFRFQGDTKSWAVFGVPQDQMLSLQREVQTICQTNGVQLQF